MPSRNTTARSGMQAAALTVKDFNKRRAQFMSLAAADDLPPILLKLAYLIAFKEINLKSQTTRRAHSNFAARLGVTERHVQRLLPILTKRCGLVVQSGRGRHQISTYWIGPPPAEKTTSRSPFPTRKDDMKNTTPMSHVLNEETPREILKDLSLGVGERVDQPSADLFSLRGAAGTLTGAAPEEDQTEELELSAVEISSEPLSEPEDPKEGLPRAEQVESSEPKTDSERGVGPQKEDLAAGFAELRTLWRRGHPADETAKAIAIARAAYGKAIDTGGEHERILEAAREWIAAADAPRFLPALPGWLATHGWEKPPPQKTRTSEPRRGNGGHRRHNGYRQGKPDLARMMLEAGGVEA